MNGYFTDWLLGLVKLTKTYTIIYSQGCQMGIKSGKSLAIPVKGEEVGIYQDDVWSLPFPLLQSPEREKSFVAGCQDKGLGWDDLKQVLCLRPRPHFLPQIDRPEV